MSVEGKNADAQLEPRRGDSELRQHLQASSRRLVVRPQRVVAESLSEAGQVASNPTSRPALIPSPRRIGVAAFILVTAPDRFPDRTQTMHQGSRTSFLFIVCAPCRQRYVSTLEAGSMFWFARNRLSGS